MQIENYNEDCKDIVIALLAERKDLIYEQKKKVLWNWQYKGNPFGYGKGNGVVIKDEGEIVGFNGYMPIDVIYNHRAIKAVWSLDTIISPVCRGKGYGGNMVENVKGSASVVMGFGISDAQAHIMRKHHYNINTDVEQYFFIKKANSFASIIKLSIQYLNIAKNLIKRPNTLDMDVSIVMASDAPKEIDTLWKNVESGYDKIVKRSHSYIFWKYGQHPINNYQLIVVKKNNVIIGVGIFRNSFKMARFVDYIGPSNSVKIKQLVISVFIKQCSDSKMLECTSTDEEFKQVLENCGFRKYKDRPRFYVHSNIADDKNPHMYWFIMGGDSDGDLGYWD